MACAQYGPTAPFTQAILETLSAEALPPEDWKQLARACLSGGDFLLWKFEFAKQCKSTAEVNQGQNIPITYDMLAGEGLYLLLAYQLAFVPGAYAQVNTATKRAWYKLPPSGKPTEDLSKIRQGPDESFQDFVVRLLQAASRLLGNLEASSLLVKQLAYEYANSACQATIRPFRKKGDLSAYVRLCFDIGLSYTQELAVAAALLGKSMRKMSSD